ncbi:MAG: response regulator [Lachnospiraceae bacterium]|nr:response regulator [Lachnospiraceae bacterium]
MGKHILVVDDDAMNVRMAEFILKQQQYQVLKASSGMECLEVLKDQPVDLVLLDIEMPEMNGMQTLERIREEERFLKIPVMFLTASTELEDMENAQRLGAAGYVKKPFLPQELLDRVEKVIGQ